MKRRVRHMSSGVGLKLRIEELKVEEKGETYEWGVVFKRFWIIVNITVRTILKDKSKSMLNIRMKNKVKDKGKG